MGQLPERVAMHISALGTLMRVFAREGDELWTPLPVPSEVMADVPGLPRPELTSGPQTSTPSRALPWGWTVEVPAQEALPRDPGAPSWEWPWGAPSVVPGLAAACNHRDLEYACRSSRDDRWVDSVRTARRLFDVWEGRALVFKAPLSAAGRDRVVVERTDELESGPKSARLQRLLRFHGRLLAQPWRDRRRDVGSFGWIGDEGPDLLQMHEIGLDPGGRFQSITLSRMRWRAPGAWSEHLTLMQRAWLAAAHVVQDTGYRGPVGTDAYVHGHGVETLCEINARLTMGWIARCLIERIFSETDREIPDAVRLNTGFGLDIPEGPGVIPLVLPVRRWKSVAWLEVLPSQERGAQG